MTKRKLRAVALAVLLAVCITALGGCIQPLRDAIGMGAGTGDTTHAQTTGEETTSDDTAFPQTPEDSTTDPAPDSFENSEEGDTDNTDPLPDTDTAEDNTTGSTEESTTGSTEESTTESSSESIEESTTESSSESSGEGEPPVDPTQDPIRIYLDQGHNPSGHNLGMTCNGIEEHAATFAVGKFLAALLATDPRFEVCLSREEPDTVLGTDHADSIRLRREAAIAWGADYFISLHVNFYGEDAAVRGWEGYTADGNAGTVALGNFLLNAISEALGVPNRGMKQDPALTVLQGLPMPALLLELGFLTNAEDAAILREPEEIAAFLHRALQEYFFPNGDRPAPLPAPAEEDTDPDGGTDTGEGEKIKIYLDQGHNPSNTHNMGASGNGLNEENITYELGVLLGALLEADGRFDVRLSRPTPDTVLGVDVSTSLKARTDGAEAWGADYFISLHINAFSDAGVRGLEAFTFDEKNLGYGLGADIIAKLSEEFEMRNRGMKDGSELYVLRTAKMPAVLLEFGFITNPVDAGLLDRSPQLFAVYTYQAICDHFFAQA